MLPTQSHVNRWHGEAEVRAGENETMRFHLTVSIFSMKYEAKTSAETTI